MTLHNMINPFFLAIEEAAEISMPSIRRATLLDIASKHASAQPTSRISEPGFRYALSVATASAGA